jgi:hypothetical protein
MLQNILHTPPIYNNTITAPTTPNRPAPTFTTPAPFFPLLVVDAAAVPVLVLLSPVALVAEPVVFALLLLPVVLELPLVVVSTLALLVDDSEDSDVVEDGGADETVFVDSMENCPE